MSTILVNGVNSKLGGGASVLNNFLTIGANHSNHDFIVVVGADSEPCPESANIRVRQLPRWQSQLIAYPYVYSCVLPALIKRERVDAVLNFGDVPIFSHTTQVMLVDTPYFAYLQSPAWGRLRLLERAKNWVKIALFRSALPYVSVVAAQTVVMRERLARLYNPRRLEVVPNAVSVDHLSGGVPRNFALPIGVNLLCLTRYYSHKNIEIFIPLAKLIRERGLPFHLIVTISPNQHPRASAFLRQVALEKLEQVIINLGPVAMAELPSLYNQVDALLLPTLLESYSGTYLEAMAQQVPILTSDLDFARTCCGEAAFYFDPTNERDILRAIERMLSDRALTTNKMHEGSQIVAAAPTWEDVANRFLALLSPAIDDTRDLKRATDFTKR